MWTLIVYRKICKIDLKGNYKRFELITGRKRDVHRKFNALKDSEQILAMEMYGPRGEVKTIDRLLDHVRNDYHPGINAGSVVISAEVHSLASQLGSLHRLQQHPDPESVELKVVPQDSEE